MGAQESGQVTGTKDKDYAGSARSARIGGGVGRLCRAGPPGG
jgi:hypothetical protein